MDFNRQVSVIVPVYNVEDYLKRCLDSLISQTIDKKEMEVILIDDGSTDNSPALCDEYAQKYDYIKVFHVENKGVSNARNFGIDKARGKYIMYLDSDDYLSKNSVKGLCNYFEKHYDEIDLMTYSEYQDKEGELTRIKHFRYNYINKTGVFDLSDPDYVYFIQTNMNIIVNNMGEENVKFDTTLIFHEDQKYILSILEKKGKIGFYKPAIYYYFVNIEGTSNQRKHPYYIHDKTIEMWENFIPDSNALPIVQAYFINDFRWKLRFDVLWPYQYKGERFDAEVERYIKLLSRVDVDLIVNYPEMSYAHKAYILGLVYGDRMSTDLVDDKYAICLDEKTLFDFENIEVYLSRFHVKNGVLSVVGVLKCVALNFTDDIKMSYTLITDGKQTEHDVKLKYSSLSYFQSQTVTSNFKGFNIKIPIKPNTKLNSLCDGCSYVVSCHCAETELVLSIKLNDASVNSCGNLSNVFDGCSILDYNGGLVNLNTRCINKNCCYELRSNGLCNVDLIIINENVIIICCCNSCIILVVRLNSTNFFCGLNRLITERFINLLQECACLNRLCARPYKARENAGHDKHYNGNDD